MPTEFRRRPQPCSHCGDVVLISERRLGKLFGKSLGVKPVLELEHADPGADGEMFDPVDEGCRRPRVTG